MKVREGKEGEREKESEDIRLKFSLCGVNTMWAAESRLSKGAGQAAGRMWVRGGMTTRLEMTI